jgi:LuxR family transcriptional regulator, maltose regulon positive regulatory protein
METFAKITRPIAAEIFPRKRLYRLLDQSRLKPATFVSGPPGSGKTSLVAGYIRDRKLPCLWYQMDEGDADPATFFYFMGLAAKKAAPRYKTPLPLFTPEYGFGVPTFSRRYFENLCSRLKPPCVLVFDNYQEIPSDSVIHGIIRTGLSAFPEKMSAVIISRSETPTAFAALQGENQLGVMDWNDLRLTFEESKGIAKLQGAGRFQSRLYDWLHEKAGGWATGLVLLVRAVKSEGIDPETLGDLAPEKVFDYFSNELFGRLGRRMQEFLLKTAFVPKITPDLAEGLTGNKAAGKILWNLNQSNYFTEKRARPELIYQYHSLFRDFLITRAASRFPSAEISGLRLEAANLLNASGQTEDAAELFIQAGAWKELMTLVQGNALTLIRQGRSKLLEKWITALPEEKLKSDPWPNYWLATCRLSSNPVQSRALFERAFGLFGSSGDEAGTLLAWSGAVQTFLYVFDDFSPLDRWIAWLDERGGKDASFPSPEIALIVAAGMTAALSWRNPVHPDTQKWVDWALSLSKNSPNIEASTRAYTNGAVYYIWSGMFGECGVLISELKRMVAAQPVSPLRSLVLKHTEAMFYNTSTEYQPHALQAVTEGLKDAQKTGVHVVTPLLLNQGVISSLNQGNPGLAEEFLLKLEKTLRSGSRTHAGHYYYLSACHDLYTGKVPQALLSAKKSLELVQETGVPVSVFLARLVLSHALNEAGNEEEASRELAATKRAVAQTGSFYFEYLYGLTEAYFEDARGDEHSALESLRKAMTLGRQKGFATHLYFWRPAVMSRLCGKALREGIEVEYAQNLIRKLNLVPDEQSMGIETWPWPVKIFLLGRFEISVDGKPVQFSGKVQKKPLLLLKALVALGGAEVKAEKIEDVLWPESDGDVAHQTFETTLHRLRKWIGHPDAFDFSSGLAALNREVCWTDVWAFENLLEEAGNQERQGKLDRAVDFMEKGISLYKGIFLPGEIEESWAVSPRERLRRKFLMAVHWLGRHWEEAGEWEKALSCYDRGLQVDDISEEFYQQMMNCYHRLGRIAEGLDTYERCKRVLSAVLGVKPSAKTEAVRKSLL